MKKLKLYVWENVLIDYTPGVMFAVAESVKDARKIIIKKSNGDPSVISDLMKQNPKAFNGKAGFYLYGGG